jgi:hypothetical protein
MKMLEKSILMRKLKALRRMDKRHLLMQISEHMKHFSKTKKKASG